MANINEQLTNLGSSFIDNDLSTFVGEETANDFNNTSEEHTRPDSGSDGCF